MAPRYPASLSPSSYRSRKTRLVVIPTKAYYSNRCGAEAQAEKKTDPMVGDDLSNTFLLYIYRTYSNDCNNYYVIFVQSCYVPMFT